MAPFLNLEHVFDAQKGFLRPLVEGRLAVDNIANIGVRSRHGNEVHVEATVVRSTNISKEPVTVNVRISIDEPIVEKKIVHVSCTCPAGACKNHCCKHAMAVLIFLERNDESTLEILTCTDTRQAWGKVRNAAMAKFDPVPLSDFCHFPKVESVYHRQVKEVTSEMSQRFKAMFLEDRPMSEAAIFISGAREPAAPRLLQQAQPTDKQANFFESCLKNQLYLVEKIHNLSQDLLAKCSLVQQTYYQDNVVLSKAEAHRVFLDSQGQNNEIWDEARFGRLTGSTSYKCYTYYVNKNPDWDHKLEEIFAGSFHNDAMDGGNFYESYALEKYVKDEQQKDSGLVDAMQVGIFINPALPWLGFSADAIIFKDNECFKLWENKTPVKGRTVCALEICKHVAYCNRDTGNLKQMHSYYGQIQLGMCLLNIPACDFSIYCTGPLSGINVVPNPNLESIHVETVVINESFCVKYLERLCHVYFEKVLPWLCSKSK